MLAPFEFAWPVYPNTRLDLGQQKVVLRIGNKEASTTVTAFVEMLPRPGILFETAEPNLPFDINSDFQNRSDADLLPATGKKRSKLEILHAQKSDVLLIRAALQDNEILRSGKTQNVERLRGSVLNFYECFDPVDSFHVTRTVEFAGSGFAITLQGNPKTAQVFSGLHSRGGYAVTHVFDARKADGSVIDPATQLDILEALAFFFSLVRGAYCGVGFTSGYFQDSGMCWSEWGWSKTSRWSTSWNWFVNLRGDSLRELFPRFMEMWRFGLHKHFRALIDMYCEANRDEVDVRPALILAQAALELMSWIVFVKGEAVSPEGFEKLSAEDHIKLLLHECGIPVQIPQILSRFTAAAKSNGHDGPSLLVEIRNSLVHPGKKNSAAVSPELLIEARYLAMWYLELTILHSLKYQGQYFNRLKTFAFPGPAVERVPWAS